MRVSWALKTHVKVTLWVTPPPPHTQRGLPSPMCTRSSSAHGIVLFLGLQEIRCPENGALCVFLWAVTAVVRTELTPTLRDGTG